MIIRKWVCPGAQREREGREGENKGRKGGFAWEHSGNAKDAKVKTKDAKEGYNVLRVVAHQRRNDWQKVAERKL
jgi:hypothetical protein